MRPRARLSESSILALLVLLTAGTLQAAPGDLDPTFDGDGKVTTAIGTGVDQGLAVAVQADGRIVVGGAAAIPATTFALVRYNVDGTLDTGFSGDGIVTTPIASSGQVWALAIQSDGRIVAAGQSSPGEFAVVRYNDDGTLDSNFDGDGIVVTTVSAGFDAAYGIALQDDGKIVVVGEAVGATDTDFAVVRYNDDGSLDTSFDGDGIVITAIPGGSGTKADIPRGVAIDPVTGKIVVAGSSQTGAGVSRMVLVRYDDDGTLDTSFDGDGIVTANLSGDEDTFLAVALQDDGRIVAGGQYAAPVDGHDFIVARFEDDGTPDTSFDGDGFVITALEVPGNDAVASIIVQADGNIVAAGLGGGFPNPSTFGIVRYLSDGTLDAGFGTGGIVTTMLGSGTGAFALGAALAPTDKLVLAGFALVSGNLDFAAARYDLGALGPTPTPAGTATPTPTATPTTTATATPTVTATPLCPVAPIAPCRTPAVANKAFLQMKDGADDGKDSLQWKWMKGAVTIKDDFGDPTTGESYRLCIYAGTGPTPPVILDARIPAGGMCNAAHPVACWKDKPKGYSYKDKDGTPDGIEQLSLSQGLAGAAKISIKGRGTLLDDTSYPIAQPVRVQLSNDGGVCWEAVYGAPAPKNSISAPFEFKDKAD